VTNGAIITTTDYAGNYIYQNNALQMINQPEGYLEPNGQGGYDYGYQLKDHLGNIRLTFVDYDNNGSIALTEITEENNYYPFGLKHQGYNNTISSNANAVAGKFKYNSKELNDELGLDLYDYGARFYDAALGRFHTIDPAVENQHHNYTPYAYVYNNPIRFIDPMGLDSAQRATAVAMAEEYVKKNPGNSWEEGRGQPGENTDCSGMVSACMMKAEEPDPYPGNTGSGVSRIVQASEKVKDKNDVEVGNVITLDNSTSGKDKPKGHIGIIIEVKTNDMGKTVGYKIIDSGGSPSKGKSGPRYTNITLGGKGYWDSRVTGIYKWDKKPEVYNAGTLKTVYVYGQGQARVPYKPMTTITIK
jgi:RHS repeat-associated protein